MAETSEDKKTDEISAEDAVKVKPEQVDSEATKSSSDEPSNVEAVPVEKPITVIPMPKHRNRPMTHPNKMTSHPERMTSHPNEMTSHPEGMTGRILVMAAVVGIGMIEVPEGK